MVELAPSDIPRPSAARDPGVTASPALIRDPRGEALHSFANDMNVVAGTFAELQKKRQAAEDVVGLGRADLIAIEEYDPVIAGHLDSIDATAPDSVQRLDKKLEATQARIDERLAADGVHLSAEGRAALDASLMQSRVAAARRATLESHNQRVFGLVDTAEKDVNEIARRAAATGNLQGGLAKVDEITAGLAGVVASDKASVIKKAARATVLRGVVEAHNARGEFAQAQAIVDAETGFASDSAGLAEQAIVNAAKDQGVDPAVAVAIATIESGLDPTAKNPASSARGLFQITKATAAGLGLPESISLAPVADQAKAGAQLIAANTATLRQALGGEPTPAEIYLAHFIGAGDAARVLKADPDTKVSEILSAEVVAANPHIANMTAADFHEWASTRMRRAMAATADAIAGRKVDARAATIPLDDAIALGKLVASARREAGVGLKAQIVDDLASIRQTGKPVDIDTDKAAAVLSADDMEKWSNGRDDAGVYFDTTKDMATLPAADILGRIAAMAPQPGEVGFARAQKLQDDVRTEATRVMKSRGLDPDKIAEGTARLADPNGNFDPFDPGDRAVADHVFRASGGVGEGMADEAGRRRIVDMVTRTGIIPKSALNQIRHDVAGNDPGVAGAALTMAAEIYDRAPQAFDSYDGARQVRETVASFQHLTDERGMSSTEAAAHLIQLRAPESARQAAVLKPLADAFIKDLTLAEVTNAFDPSIFVSEPLAGFNAALSEAMLNDYRGMARDAFVGDARGDAGVAKAMALAEIKRIYGATNINGKSTLMRLPPEHFYPAINGSYDYLRDDARASAEFEARVQGAGPVKDVFIQSTPTTAADIREGRPPRYKLYYATDENGQTVWSEVLEKNFGFTPEQLKGVRETERQKRIKDLMPERERAKRIQRTFVPDFGAAMH